MAGAELKISFPIDPWLPGMTTETGADGEFSLEIGEQGPIRLAIEGAGIVGDTLLAGPTGEAIELRLRRRAAVRGQVIEDLRKSPVAAFTLAFLPASGPSQLEWTAGKDLGERARIENIQHRRGEFELSGLRDGTYDVFVLSPGHETFSVRGVRVQIGMDPLGPFELRALRRPILSVVDEDGRPLSAAVALPHLRDGLGQLHPLTAARVRSDSRGKLILPFPAGAGSPILVECGELRAILRTPEECSGEVRLVRWEPIEIELPDGCYGIGRAVSDRGEACEMGFAEGTLELPPLPAGRYEVQVALTQGTGWALGRFPVEHSGASPTNVRRDGDATLRLRGKGSWTLVSEQERWVLHPDPSGKLEMLGLPRAVYRIEGGADEERSLRLDLGDIVEW